MNPAPDILKLLSWSQRLAAGEPCADWQAWREQSPDSQWQWPRIALSGEMLEAGLARDEELDLTADNLAAWLDGGLEESQAADAAKSCWQSPAQLAEVASAANFRDESALLADASPGLTQRLLELGPQPAKWRLDGVAVLPVAAPLPPPVIKAVPLVSVKPERLMRRADEKWPLWLMASAAALAAVIVTGAIGWFVLTPPPHRSNTPPIANGPPQPPPAPLPNPPPLPRPPEIPPKPAPAQSPLPVPPDEPPARPIESPSSVPPDSPPAPAPMKRPQPWVPPRRPAAPAPPLLAFRPAVGVLLVQEGVTAWRAAGGERPLTGRTRILSLAESWSAVDVPSVGTLVCDGPVEAVLEMRESGGLDIALAHGRLGIQDLAAGKEVRVQAGGASWTARGLDHYSTLAVLADPAAPQILVPTGAALVNQFNVAANQRLLWQQGLAQPPVPIAAASPAAVNAAPPAVPALGDPLDLAWLQPPKEDRRKQFQALYGRTLDRLATTDDAASELAKLLETSRDARTAALLARWNVALADDVGRAAQTWAMLSDHRVFVRLAGVRALLELPPGDKRLLEFDRLLRSKVPAGAADRVSQWLVEVRQPVPLPGPRAVELVDFLTHSELGLRQLAVSLLELHAAPGLARLRAAPPAYDAAGPAQRRAAAQIEWRNNLRPIFAPAIKNAPAAALAPAAAGS